MGTAFVDGFDRASGEGKSYSSLEFRYINALFLEIDVFATRPSRIELGSASAVRISTSHLRTPL